MVIYILIFVLGLVIGSFLNCVIFRLGKESFLKGFSKCPYCEHPLKGKDLIPVVSFLLLKGKCRYCGKKISFQYPLVELSTAILFVLVIHFVFIKFAPFSFVFQLLVTCYLLLVTCLLIIIFVYDLKHFVIPDKVIYVAILGSCLWYLGSGVSLGKALTILSSAIGCSLFFFLIYFFSQGKWLGLGDVKLGFFMGLFLGFPNIVVALFLAFLIGAIIGVVLIVLKKRSLKSKVPFAPFLVVGTFIALFFGKELIKWYLSLFYW